MSYFLFFLRIYKKLYLVEYFYSSRKLVKNVCNPLQTILFLVTLYLIHLLSNAVVNIKSFVWLIDSYLMEIFYWKYSVIIPFMLIGKKKISQQDFCLYYFAGFHPKWINTEQCCWLFLYTYWWIGASNGSCLRRILLQSKSRSHEVKSKYRHNFFHYFYTTETLNLLHNSIFCNISLRLLYISGLFSSYKRSCTLFGMISLTICLISHLM